MNPAHEAGLRNQLERFKDIERGGWKVGLTSGASRDGMGVGFRPFGHIATAQIFESGVTLERRNVGDIGVENELCFKFRDTVPRGADKSRLRTCIEAVLPAFELNERRLASSATDKDRLSDNLSQFGIVVGRPLMNFQSLELADLDVTLFEDGEEVETVASRGHIDDHYDSLLALVDVLGKFDQQIGAGDLVITGAFARRRVLRASTWRGEFSLGIGTVEVSFK